MPRYEASSNIILGYVWFPESLKENVCEEKKIEKTSVGKQKKSEGKEKIDFKSINYFYILLQIHFTYLTLLYKD